jgi:hypothetical protein
MMRSWFDSRLTKRLDCSDTHTRREAIMNWEILIDLLILLMRLVAAGQAG